MKNVAIIVVLLLSASGVAKLFGVEARIAGRVGIAAVFGFTALGHFVKRDQMAAMLPSSMSAWSAIVTLSGLLEVLFAVLILIPSYSRMAGIAISLDL